LIPQVAPPEIQIVRLRTPGLTAFEHIETFRRQAQSNLLRDGAAQLPLELEDAAWLAVE
jgi:hypothetical protein